MTPLVVEVTDGKRTWFQKGFAGVCIICGDEFVSAAANAKRCSSEECHAEYERRRSYVNWLRLTGKPDGPVPPRRESMDPEVQRLTRRLARHERRAIERLGTLKPKAAALLVAGAKRCAICDCGLSTDLGKPNSKHLDHIVPINVGGLHVRENVRVVCRTCNLRRPLDGSDVQVVSLFQVAIAFTPPPSKTRVPKPRREPRYSQELRDRAAYLRSEGMGYKRIAAELGLKRDTVRGWFRAR